MLFQNILSDLDLKKKKKQTPANYMIKDNHFRHKNCLLITF